MSIDSAQAKELQDRLERNRAEYIAMLDEMNKKHVVARNQFRQAFFDRWSREKEEEIDQGQSTSE